MRGVIAAATVVVVACSDSYRDAPSLVPDGGTDAGAEAGPDATSIEISPADIDFGSVECGTAAPPSRIVLLRNRGKTASTYRLELPDGAPFEVQGPLEGELAADAITAVNVVARPSAAGENLSSIIVSAGASILQIPLKASGDGGRIVMTPNVADIGGVRYQNGGSIDVTLVNSGTKPVTLADLDSSNADITATWPSSPAPLTLDPMVQHKVTVKLAPGAEGPPLVADVTPRIEGPHCGVAPPLPVKGQRVSIDVTIGRADFGNQACKSTPTLTRDIAIANYTASSLSYTAKLTDAASQFTIVSGAADTIAPGSSATPTTKKVTLGLKPLGTALGAISEDVEIDVTGVAAPAGGVRTTVATANVRGVVLTVNPTVLDAFGYFQQRPFELSNSGNETASLSFAYAPDPGTSEEDAWVLQHPGTLAAGAKGQGTVRFAPSFNKGGDYAGTFTFLVSGPKICNAPPTLRVSATQ